VRCSRDPAATGLEIPLIHDITPEQNIMPRIRLCALVLVFCQVIDLHAAPAPQVATGTRGMVVSVSAAASETGIEVLKRGGNAVDAAIAVAFVLAVTWPEAGNIGGGGFMMVQPAPGQKAVCIEYRETAPAAATVEMFSTTKSRLGCKIVGIPGTPRGLWLASQQFGRLPWAELVEPAQRLADQGFPVDAALAASLNRGLSGEAPTPEFRRVYGKANGTPWRAGDSLQQPDLARTLALIAHQGVDAFYQGSIAQLIA
jgi:gamma-glutamyltranspeptidase/glutathione hydrolase